VLRSVFWSKFATVLEVLAASIIRALMMEAASTSEMSVNFYQTTRRNIPEIIFILAAVRTCNLTYKYVSSVISEERLTL
jgi:hypothetical protein